MSQWLCQNCFNNVFPFNNLKDSNDFIAAISENWFNDPLPNVTEMGVLTFNLFDLDNDEHRSTRVLEDADPDTNFFKETLNKTAAKCYITLEEEFNNIYNHYNLSSDRLLSLLHLNVRSIAKNLDHLRNYLKLLTHEFAIIGFTETWFNDVTVSRYKLENYNQVSNYRRTKKGGGVTLSIHKSITFKERQEWKVLNPDIETVFAELEKTFFKTPRNVLIGVIYRPPNSDVNSFIEQLADILHKLARENKLVYLMGDFNINLFNSDKFLLTRYS